MPEPENEERPRYESSLERFQHDIESLESPVARGKLQWLAAIGVVIVLLVLFMLAARA